MLHYLLLTKTPAELLQLQKRALQVCAEQSENGAPPADGEDVADIIPLPTPDPKAAKGEKSGRLYVFQRPSDADKP